MTRDELRTAVGSRLRGLRRAARLTLSDVSTKSGVSLGFISQIERGRNTPALETLYSLTQALGVSLAAFFEHLQETP